jgi:hypothetical protein
MLISNFTYPLRCLRVPPGVSVPPVEYHCSREYQNFNRIPLLPSFYTVTITVLQLIRMHF